MGKLPLIAAVASAMWTLPVSAGDGGNAMPSKPEVTLAQLERCVGPDCRDRDRVYREGRYYNRGGALFEKCEQRAIELGLTHGQAGHTTYVDQCMGKRPRSPRGRSS